MRIRNLVLILAVAIIAALVALSGCKKKEEPVAPAQAPARREMPAQAEEVKETATATAEEAKKTVETATASVEQTMCPVMDGNKIDKNVFVEYKGKKVYFCCADCKAKFEADPEKYVANLPQFKQ
ncbi:MAG: YHS domain-containing protein [Planctomycetota bacterium]